MRLDVLFAAMRGSPGRFAERSPVRLLLTLAALVFVAEAGVMGLLALLPPQAALAEALLDAALLTTLVFPLLYLLVFEPMRRGIFRHEQAARSLRESHEHLRRAVRATDTLYSALRAGRGALDQDALIQVVAELARTEADAELGAVAIREPAGRRIRRFATAGFPRELAPPGALPEGRGLLSALVDGRPVRSDDTAQDPRRAGLPAWHPPLAALLGVPVGLRGEHWGEIYVANRRGGGSFGEDEEASLRSLATFLTYALEHNEARAASAAEATVRQTTELVAGCAHEISNAVTAARLNLQALRELASGGATHAGGDIGDMAGESLESLDRVSALMKKTQAAVSARFTVAEERVNVPAVLRDIAARVQAETGMVAAIAIETPEEAWLAGPAADRVSFVLDTLLRWCAGRAAAGAGGSGDVSAGVTRAAAGAVVVDIRLREMPFRESVETIFEPAYRPTAAEGGRMGFDFDLLLVRAAVQAAGARIEAIPAGDRQGLSFRVEFPPPGAGSEA